MNPLATLTSVTLLSPILRTWLLALLSIRQDVKNETVTQNSSPTPLRVWARPSSEPSWLSDLLLHIQSTQHFDSTNFYSSAYKLRFIGNQKSELIKYMMGDPAQQQSSTVAVLSESLHQDRSSIIQGGRSVSHSIRLNEQEAIGNSSKEFTKFPEDKDLLSRFQVACVIINRMMGMSPSHNSTCLCSDHYSHMFRDGDL